MLVTLGNVRVAFANLFEAKQVQGQGEFKFSGCFILTPGDKNCKTVEAALTEVAKERWGEKGIEVARKLFEENRVCYLRRAKTDGNNEIYQGFEDSYSISSSNKARPTVVDRDNTVPLVAADGKPYSGCYVNGIIDIWAQDNGYGRRLNATLKGVQFVKDGDAFSGGTAVSADAFDDLGVDESTDEAPESGPAKPGSLF